MASILLATYLWLFFGLFGVHHWYLRRPYHAFVWFVSLGGLGVGWLCDLCYLTDFRDETEWSLQDLNDFHLTRRRQASCSTVRFFGQLIIGTYFGYLGLLFLPQEFHDQFLLRILGAVVIACTTSWGVHMVGNIGFQQRSFIDGAKGALGSLVLTLVDISGSAPMAAICASLSSNRTAQWRSERKEFGYTKLAQWISLYLILWSGILMRNVKVYVDGEMKSAGQALWENDWTKSLESIQSFHAHYQNGTYGDMKDDFFDIFRNFVETYTFATSNDLDTAYKVLKLDKTVAKDEIKRKCRKMLKENHPDKQRTATDKQKERSQERFLKIEQACDLLTKARARRHRQFYHEDDEL